MYPDDYQHKRAHRFNRTDRAIGIALKRLNITQKKSLNHPKADKDKRTQFSLELSTYQEENRPIIYLDESGFK